MDLDVDSIIDFDTGSGIYSVMGRNIGFSVLVRNHDQLSTLPDIYSWIWIDRFIDMLLPGSG